MDCYELRALKKVGLRVFNKVLIFMKFRLFKRYDLANLARY